MTREPRHNVWPIVAAAALLLSPVLAFVAAYLESLLIGTQYVEDFFRWLGIHDEMRDTLHRLLL